MIKILKVSLQQNLIFIIIFFLNLRLFLLFYDVYKEKMLTVEIEDGRKAH